MPVWHKQIKDLVKNDDIAIIGIIQEQHADRCRLFAQWQQFDWPILQDPMNVIPARAVPIAIAVDEHGVVRNTRPDPEWVRETFVKTKYEAPAAMPDINTQSEVAPKEADQNIATIKTAHAHALWGLADMSINKRQVNSLNKAIAAYDAVIQKEPANAPAYFGRGVALRMRYEASNDHSADFSAAIESWTKALELDPNQYIYRRRLEQYGPRLTKPYPFYDWVRKAREDILARGEKPYSLVVEPRGAEIAGRSRKFDQTTATNPDPNGRIDREKTASIEIQTSCVPLKVVPGRTARLHLDLRPKRGTKWNNEAEPVQIWIDAPARWQLQSSLFSLTQPSTASSTEPRTIDFEIEAPSNAKDTTLSGFALYHVCDEDTGICRFARLDFRISVSVTE